MGAGTDREKQQKHRRGFSNVRNKSHGDFPPPDAIHLESSGSGDPSAFPGSPIRPNSQTETIIKRGNRETKVYIPFILAQN